MSTVCVAEDPIKCWFGEPWCHKVRSHFLIWTTSVLVLEKTYVDPPGPRVLCNTFYYTYIPHFTHMNVIYVTSKNKQVSVFIND